MTKKIINAIEEIISPYDFDGNLKNAKKKIADLIAIYGEDVELNFNSSYHYDYDPDVSPIFEVKVRRMENDEEYAKRIADDTRITEYREAHDLREYERLQQKFNLTRK